MVRYQTSNALPDAPYTDLIQSHTSVSWRPTFEPLKEQLPRAYDWIKFGHIDDGSGPKALADPWIEADKEDQNLERLVPEFFVRNRVIENTNLDLAASGILQAAVSVDRSHHAVILARMARGQAQPVHGHDALHVLLPSVGDMSWEDIDAMRRRPDIMYYRDFLREIESSASGQTHSLREFEVAMQKEYEENLRRANERVAANFSERLRLNLINLVLGTLLSYGLGSLGSAIAGSPGALVGGIVGSTAGAAVSLMNEEARMRRSEPRWLSVDTALRRGKT